VLVNEYDAVGDGFSDRLEQGCRLLIDYLD
jgi:hypothetical protein